jgi:phosphatidylethanolamine/phosphatidyl-N-methylethanolamine N-methyltransferase
LDHKSRKSEGQSRWLFIRQFFEKPKEVASVIPSSPNLVEGLLAGINFSTIKLVIEYGPGTGAITYEILKKIPTGTKFIAAEPNAVFRSHLLEENLPIEIIPDYAQNIASRVLESHGPADLVVSGLPCSIMPLPVLKDLFESTKCLLKDGAEFRMFVYTHTLMMPKMHQMFAILRKNFSQVDSSIVWLNIPPATIIRCRK